MRMIMAAAAALLAAVPAAAFAPSTFYIFGDSFIDAGNIEAATGGTIPNPALGYWEGRFSDGPTWADQLGWANLGAPVGPSLLGGNNFAFGGARAAVDDIISVGPPVVAIPGLATQGGFYVAANGPVADPNALYIINFGNNDVNAIQTGDTEGLTVPQYQAAYVGNMVGAVAQLSAWGAQHILILGVPNPTEVEGQILQGLLNAQLDAVEPALTANLYRFDYFAFFNQLQVDPTVYGLRADLIIDQSRNCLAEVGPFQDCSQYVLFDGIHVTEEVHVALANEIAKLTGLAPVPEPATWGMMLAGFGAVGFAVRRRRASLAA